MSDDLKIPIKRYVMDPNASWEERYKQLEAHHFDETMWLIDEVKRLRRPVKPRCRAVWRAGVLVSPEGPNIPDGARCLLEPHDEATEHKFSTTVEKPEAVRGRLAIMYSEPQTLICTTEGSGIATVHGDSRQEREQIARWIVEKCDAH